MANEEFDAQWAWFQSENPGVGNRNDPDPENKVWPIYERWREQKAREVAEFGSDIMFEQLHNNLEQQIASVAFQLRAADEDLRAREENLRKQIEDGSADLKAQADVLEAARAELRAEVDKVAAARTAFNNIDPELLVRMAAKQPGEPENLFRMRTGKHSNEQ